MDAPGQKKHGQPESLTCNPSKICSILAVVDKRNNYRHPATVQHADYTRPVTAQAQYLVLALALKPRHATNMR